MDFTFLFELLEQLDQAFSYTLLVQPPPPPTHTQILLQPAKYSHVDVLTDFCFTDSAQSLCMLNTLLASASSDVSPPKLN